MAVPVGTSDANTVADAVVPGVMVIVGNEAVDPLNGARSTSLVAWVTWFPALSSPATPGKAWSRQVDELEFWNRITCPMVPAAADPMPAVTCSWALVQLEVPEAVVVDVVPAARVLEVDDEFEVAE